MTYFKRQMKLLVVEGRWIKVKFTTRSNIWVSYCGGRRHPHRLLGGEVSSTSLEHVFENFHCSVLLLSCPYGPLYTNELNELVLLVFHQIDYGVCFATFPGTTPSVPSTGTTTVIITSGTPIVGTTLPPVVSTTTARITSTPTTPAGCNQILSFM